MIAEIILATSATGFVAIGSGIARFRRGRHDKRVEREMLARCADLEAARLQTEHERVLLERERIALEALRLKLERERLLQGTIPDALLDHVHANRPVAKERRWRGVGEAGKSLRRAALRPAMSIVRALGGDEEE